MSTIGSNLQEIQHRAYHSWQLVFRNPADFMWKQHSLPTALHKTEEFFLKYLIYKFCRWISPEIHMKSSGFHVKSARFHEIKNVSFWVITKYRSFFRKTKHQPGQFILMARTPNVFKFVTFKSANYLGLTVNVLLNISGTFHSLTWVSWPSEYITLADMNQANHSLFWATIEREVPLPSHSEWTFVGKSL